MRCSAGDDSVLVRVLGIYTSSPRLEAETGLYKVLKPPTMWIWEQQVLGCKLRLTSAEGEV